MGSKVSGKDATAAEAVFDELEGREELSARGRQRQKFAIIWESCSLRRQANAPLVAPWLNRGGLSKQIKGVAVDGYLCSV